MVENRRTILRSHIIALPVQSSRVVNGKEDFQNFAVWNYIRGKCDVDCFGVASLVAANILIRRFYFFAAGVTGNNSMDTFHFLENSSRHQKHPLARVATSSPGILSSYIVMNDITVLTMVQVISEKRFLWIRIKYGMTMVLRGLCPLTPPELAIL